MLKGPVSRTTLAPVGVWWRTGRPRRVELPAATVEEDLGLRQGRRRLFQYLLAILLFAIPSLVYPGGASAQASDDAGQRLRVTLRPSADRQQGELWQRQLVGTMIGITGDSLTLSLDPEVGRLTLAEGDVRRIEISKGVPGRVVSALQRGIGGAIWGAIVGSLYNLAFEDDDSVSVGDSALRWAGVAGTWGAATGAIAPQEGWRRTRWDELD